MLHTALFYETCSFFRMTFRLVPALLADPPGVTPATLQDAGLWRNSLPFLETLNPIQTLNPKPIGDRRQQQRQQQKPFYQNP